MPKTLWSVAAAVMLLPRGAVAQAATTPRAAIQAVLDQQTAAANALDTDRFLAAYRHDSTLVMVFNGAVIVGFDSVRAAQLRWWNNGKSDVVYSRRGPAIYTVLTPDVVVVTQPLASTVH